jgi:hypothetical protein
MKTGLGVRLPPIIVAVWLMVAFPVLVQAQFNYTTNNGTISITGYDGTNSAVTIPGTLNGLRVDSIGSNAFWGNWKVTSFTITNNVASIGFGAFGYCTSLTNVVMGTNVSSIGGYAFKGCSKLTSLSIPNSVTSIGDWAFLLCSGLTNVTIGLSVTNIGNGAFGNSGLIAIVIPNSVMIIGTNAFAGTRLTNVTIPDSVTNLEGTPFLGCYSMPAITVDTNNPAYSSLGGVVFNKTQTALIEYPSGNLVTSYAIRNGVTNIGAFAFWGCLSLIEVTIPNSVTTIGDFAFNQSVSLARITIPDSVTTIGSWAFTDSLGLTAVEIGSNVTTIGDTAFASCLNLKGVYFKGNAPTLLSGVFANDNATVYYLPGTAGWSTNFAGLPTAIWTPEVQTGDASFGVKSNTFGFNVSWASGMSVVVEASPTLSNPVWSPVATNNLNGGTFYFRDPAWKKYPSRFYRVRSQ